MHLNLFIAFTSGLLSFLAPCVVPLLPAYVGYISGVSLPELQARGVKFYRRELLLSSVMFLLGFAIVFVILGTTAAGLGSAIRHQAVVIQRLGGIVVMVFAVSFLGLFQLPFLSRLHGLQIPPWAAKLGVMRGFLVGIVLATAWTPCVGAVLGAMLTLAAATQTAVAGAIMLFAYSLGISIPFLVISLLLTRTPTLLTRMERFVPVVTTVSGVLLLLIGFLLFNNTVGWIHPMLTYDRLNSVLFEIAFRFGYQIR